LKGDALEIDIEGIRLKLNIIQEAPELEPPAGVTFLTQVHGSRVVFSPEGREEADGMVMPRGKGCPGLRVADCLPVFAFWKGFTGAAHAGWRGLAQGVVENLLNAVDEPPLILVFGPCICSGCYEVGEDVRESVARGDPMGIAGHPPGRADLRGGALRRARKVRGAGFPVISLNSCTLETPGLHSHRRNGTPLRNIMWLAEGPSDYHIRHPYHEHENHPPRGD